MRHRVATFKLNRTMAHRRAMLRNMATSLIVEERLETTLAKAKELRRVADRMVTLGKRGTLHARRQAASYVRSQSAVQKLFGDLAGRFTERQGGYTRVLKLGFRRGDTAPMAIIEYLGAPLKPTREERRQQAEKEKAQKAQAKEKLKSKKAKKTRAKEKPVTTAPAEEKKKARAPKKKEKESTKETEKKTVSKKTKAEPKPERKAITPKEAKKGVLRSVFGRRTKKQKKDR